MSERLSYTFEIEPQAIHHKIVNMFNGKIGEEVMPIEAVQIYTGDYLQFAVFDWAGVCGIDGEALGKEIFGDEWKEGYWI